jgi:hypothetical protein
VENEECRKISGKRKEEELSRNRRMKKELVPENGKLEMKKMRTRSSKVQEW